MSKSGFAVRTAAVAALAVGAAAVTGSSALASGPVTVRASISSVGFGAQFAAQISPGAPADSARGVFSAQVALGPLPLLGVAGPVTCMQVTKDAVGVFYPIAQSSLPLLAGPPPKGVLFSVDFNAAGRATAVSFLPLPVPQLSSCAPLPGLLPASGTVSVTG
ncbi:MAG TPA: hypothetical protein VHX88_03145 [Solirubrobacteraceae bacterium]|jgi:hypothetical protein|nr:hypothetical protein [Solirubrobacteraceae bacterium]